MVLQSWKVSKQRRNWSTERSSKEIEVFQFAEWTNEHIGIWLPLTLLKLRSKCLKWCSLSKAGLSVPLKDAFRDITVVWISRTFTLPVPWRSRTFTWPVWLLHRTPLQLQQSFFSPSLPQEERKPNSSTRLCLNFRSASHSSSMYLMLLESAVFGSNCNKMIAENKTLYWNKMNHLDDIDIIDIFFSNFSFSLNHGV